MTSTDYDESLEHHVTISDSIEHLLALEKYKVCKLGR